MWMRLWVDRQSLGVFTSDANQSGWNELHTRMVWCIRTLLSSKMWTFGEKLDGMNSIKGNKSGSTHHSLDWWVVYFNITLDHFATEGQLTALKWTDRRIQLLLVWSVMCLTRVARCTSADMRCCFTPAPPTFDALFALSKHNCQTIFRLSDRPFLSCSRAFTFKWE